MDTRHPSRCWLAAVFLALALLAVWLGSRQLESAAAHVASTYASLPLAFEPGASRSGNEARFMARGRRGTVEISPTGAVLHARTDQAGERGGALGVRFAGTRGAQALRGERRLPGKTHYLRGADPRHWRTNLPTYAAVRCSGVYPGIDAVYYGHGTELEYDFDVAAGTDPAVIRLKFENTSGARVDARGDLVLECEGAEVRHCRPVAYQEVDGRRVSVEAEYALHETGPKREPEVSFHLGLYDRTRRLVIDPVLIYSTYFGGGGIELSRGAGIALGYDGSAYVVGDTDSELLPEAAFIGGGGFRDAFVTKLNPTGTAVLFTTYLGGSDSDVAHGVAIDDDGNLFVAGETFSRDFPVANALQPTRVNTTFSDAFVTKLDPTGGTVLFSTYLGGSTGSDVATAIALDASGNPWTVGATNATNFPVSSALQATPGGGYDAFVTGISANGDRLLASTYLGGAGDDRARGIAFGSEDRLFLCGSTASTNFPVLNAAQPTKGFAQDAFVTELTTGGTSLAFSTYLGADGTDVATGIAVNASGAVVTGYTGSINFPASHAYQPRPGGRGDAFVARFADSGQVIYATYLGGSGTENQATSEVGAIAVDAEGSALVTGLTASRNFPLYGASQKKPGGSTDAFIARLSPDGGSLVYGTYLGGKGDDAGEAIAVDRAGNAYVTGQTFSTNFPLRNPAQRSAAGGGDAFIAKVGNASADSTPILVLSDKNIDFGTVDARGGFFKLRVSNGGRGKLLCLVTDPESPFKLLVGGGQFSLKPKKSRTLYLQFKPTEPGDYRSTLVIDTNDPYFPTAEIQLHGVLPAVE